MSSINDTQVGLLPGRPNPPLVLNSVVCRFEHWDTGWYRRWEAEMAFQRKPGEPQYHRKLWEFAAVAQSLDERAKLRDGMRGLGFAVGTEPLPSLFAKYGCEVVATDLQPTRSASRVWRRTSQHGDSRADLFRDAIVDRETFDRAVHFEFADMNGTWPWPPGSFDFVWSCCAFEHLGSLERGMRFVRRSAQLLRPGGIAVHTTEFNVTSDGKTVSRGPGVIYRRRDVEELDRQLRCDGRCLARMDFWPGDHEYDRLYDKPPYYSHGTQHVKLEIDGFVCTSMLITVVA
jgi:SAM-dependent methyltransferase